MVDWVVKFSDGLEMTGSCEDSSWKKVARRVTKKRKLISLSVKSESNVHNIDPNRNGYFLCNKTIGHFGSNEQEDLVGIGYLDDHYGVVRIKWYHKQDMSMSHTEARSIDKCTGFLIRNKS